MNLLLIQSEIKKKLNIKCVLKTQLMDQFDKRVRTTRMLVDKRTPESARLVRLTKNIAAEAEI